MPGLVKARSAGRSEPRRVRPGVSFAVTARAGRPHSPRSRAFTVLEMIVVVTIIGLALALVAPRVGRLPSGLLTKKAVSELRAAFRTASVRSRATGGVVELALDTEQTALRLHDRGRAATLIRREGEGPGPSAGSVLAGVEDFQLPRGATWELDDHDAADERGVRFSFFPNGEATGPSIRLEVAGRRLAFEVDRLTGQLLQVAVE